jgi:hypothetical protein
LNPWRTVTLAARRFVCYGQRMTAQSEFTRDTIADAENGIYLTQAERLALVLVGDTSNKALTLRRAGQLTKARMAASFVELTDNNLENIHKWLSEVAAQSPSKAIELWIELATFSLPKLKALAVDVRSTDGSVKTMSFSELERIVSEQ